MSDPETVSTALAEKAARAVKPYLFDGTYEQALARVARLFTPEQAAAATAERRQEEITVAAEYLAAVITDIKIEALQEYQEKIDRWYSGTNEVETLPFLAVQQDIEAAIILLKSKEN